MIVSGSQSQKIDRQYHCSAEKDLVLTEPASPFSFFEGEVRDVTGDEAVFQEHQPALEALSQKFITLAYHAEGLQAYLESALSELTVHALEHCPYYQKRDLAKIQGEAYHPIELFLSMPPLGKRDLQDHLLDFWSEDAVEKIGDKIHYWTTSGSTGEPTRFLMDDFNALARDVSFWFIQFLLGNTQPEFLAQRVPEKTLMVRMTSSEGADIWFKRLPLFNNSLLWKLPVFRHSKCDLRRAVEFVYQQRPLFLGGDPQAYLTFIETWQERFPELPVYPFELKALTCSGTQLSQQAREQIETFFHTPVTDCYGLSETSIVASQCPHGSLHVHAPLNYVEVVDGTGTPLPEGQLGEIVVTNLMNKTFPLLRYNTGDMGRLDFSSPCPCGSILPILYDFHGRKRRLLVKPSGELLSPHPLVSIFVELQLYQYQLIQETPTRFRLRYIPRQPLSESDCQTVVEALSRRMGEPVTVDFEAADSLVSPGVKFQDFISHCHDSQV